MNRLSEVLSFNWVLSTPISIDSSNSTISARSVDSLDEVLRFDWGTSTRIPVAFFNSTIDKRSVNTLDEVLSFNWVAPVNVPISGNVHIQKQKINRLTDVFDLLDIAPVNLADFVQMEVSPFDFFFKLGDQAENIKVAIETVFTGIAQDAKATVPLAELVNFDSADLRPALFAAIDEGFSDGQVLGGLRGEIIVEGGTS